MVEPSAYSTRAARIPEERAAIVELWRGSLGEDARMERKFGWFYERAPQGAPLALLLEARSGADAAPAPVGVASAGRREFALEAQKLAAGVLVDMAVRLEHRTLGPALQLQKGMLATALKDMAFVYGFPNPKAAPVFQRVGYRRLGHMKRHVRVLRTSAYLARSMPPLLAHTAGFLADIVLRAWVQVQCMVSRAPMLKWCPVNEAPEPKGPHSGAEPCIHGVRTHAFLVWRFAEEHAGQYVHIAPVMPGRSFYWIAEPQGHVLQVRDCDPALLDPGGRSAWLALFREAARKGFHSVSFECFASPRQQEMLHHLGMRVRSERPVFWAAEASMADRLGASTWFLTSADEDE